LAKSLKITILLAFLVSGVGHIYLGTIKRGTIILVVGIALWLIVPLFVEQINSHEIFSLVYRSAAALFALFALFAPDLVILYYFSLFILFLGLKIIS